MRLRFLLLATAAALLAAPAVAQAVPTTFTGTAGTTGSALTSFTTAAGGPNNAATPGSQSTGFRTINWDGVPDTLQEPRALPGDFFNTTSPRGVILTTPGDSVRVSGGGGAATAYPRFADVNPGYSTDFAAFSPTHIFSPFGSTHTDVTFEVPGTIAPATVRGFGSVFTNVRIPNSSSIEYFDPSGASLGRFFAPSGANGDTEFLGVLFSTEKVARVRITSGTNPLSGSTDDNLGATPPVNVVALDDFAYAEPQPLPGPALAIRSPSTFVNTKATIAGTATDPYGIKSLVVNGQPVAVGTDGTWSTPLTLTRGANTITATATNTGGASTTVRQTVTVTGGASNKFTIGRLVYRKNGKGVAVVNLPGPGGIDLRMSARRPVGHMLHLVRRAAAGGTFSMPFKVPKKARTALAKKRYPVTERVVFKPDGGDSATHSVAVTIGFKHRR